ncbi:MAG: aminotransferase class V-fold PLP-dependent enzyme, partial [Gammaproteobacteria bacterium]|nr:aminotransferase class V-fold PLP-dependent enzyme [Gammaproteobacteria bacterium]
KLTQFGWHMVEAIGDYEQQEWLPASSARRFECGSPNMVAIHALSASLKLLLNYGMHNVEGAVLAKTSMLHQRLADIPDIEILSSTTNERYAGIVTFRHVKIDSSDLHRRLTQHGIICAQRGGGVRFSPHFYTPDSRLDCALEALELSTSLGQDL